VEEGLALHDKSRGHITANGGIPAVVQQVLASPGQPLDRASRCYMESRFGQDFRKVRIHTDEAAGRSADAIHAKAYAAGDDIVFGTGQFRPGTHDGKALLAHELVHLLQQRGASGAASETLTPYADPAENEARLLSQSVADGHTVSPSRVMATISPQSITPQLDPQKVYCALHAAVCLGLSENPPAAALCWANFAARCGGAVAAADQGTSDQRGSAAA
jgi:hypothetical protein